MFETGHCNVTRMAVVPAPAAAKLTVNALVRGFSAVNVTGEPLSSSVALPGVTPLTVPFGSTVAFNWRRGEV